MRNAIVHVVDSKGLWSYVQFVQWSLREYHPECSKSTCTSVNAGKLKKQKRNATITYSETRNEIKMLLAGEEMAKSKLSVFQNPRLRTSPCHRHNSIPLQPSTTSDSMADLVDKCLHILSRHVLIGNTPDYTRPDVCPGPLLLPAVHTELSCTLLGANCLVYVAGKAEAMEW